MCVGSDHGKGRQGESSTTNWHSNFVGIGEHLDGLVVKIEFEF